jgi:hypothetical protein
MNFLFLAFSTAIFGWFLPLVWVKIFLYPKKDIKLLGFSWQAPLYSMVQHINLEELIPIEHREKQFEKISPFIDQQLDTFFRDKLSKKMPIVSMFIGDKTISELKTVFLEELRELFPQLTVELAENVKKELLLKLSEKGAMELEEKIRVSIKKLRWLCLFIGLIWGSFAYLVFLLF